MIEQIAFYGLSTLIIGSSLGVILLNNPIYNVLFLVMSFLGAAGLYLMLNAEFLAMMLIIIYVGAIAVFFLFVVMTLDGTTHKKGESLSPKKKILAAVLGVTFTLELSFLVLIKRHTLEPFTLKPLKGFHLKQLAISLFKDHVYLLELTGIILLIAMIGAIIIAQQTTSTREVLKKQDVYKQNTRSREESVTLVKVELRKGIK